MVFKDRERLYRRADGSVVMVMEWGSVVVYLTGEISFITADEGAIAQLATDLADAGISIILGAVQNFGRLAS